jgi:uncharacterized surface protein with fasciclin (FAS1) repeats
VKAGLANALSAADGVTLLAPTNDAFAQLNPTVVNSLTVAQLGDILKYHVLGSRLSSINLASHGHSWQSMQGAGVKITGGAAGNVIVDFAGVTVSMSDIQCSNGVVHVINRVLLPPAGQTVAQVVASDPALSTLASVIKASDLAMSAAFSGFNVPTTLFAPTNDALGKLPSTVVQRLLSAEYAGFLVQVLMFHSVSQNITSSDLADRAVVPSRARIDSQVLNHNVFLPPGFKSAAAYIDSATIVATNIPASNGIIHKVDSLLVPSGLTLPLNVVEQAVTINALSTLGMICCELVDV